ncbi:tyrosine-type recombinase/integrase [Pseudomonas sp. EMN2]|uniref:tyrosine-type recombinase/integrase n=1 Tax=Pseudomonas sp. EMN2 TaxID=2615212 RepID=UPI00129B902E|nr:tyrosine-type recombinase/integrase [Pseudomonas sp. EMN2]
MSGSGELIPANSAGAQSQLIRPTADSYTHSMDQVLRAFLAPLAVSSQEKVRMCLGQAALALGFEDWPLEQVPWDRVDAPVVMELVARWRDQLARPTLALYIYAVRGMARACFLHDLMSAEQYNKLKAVPLPNYGEGEGRGQYVKSAWLDAMIASCKRDERTTLGLRDHALLALLYGSGIRRAEAASLAREDLDLAGGRFRVVVKGGKKAVRFLAPWAIKPIKEWLDEVDRQALASQNQPVVSGPVSRRRRPKPLISAEGLVLRRLSKAGRILGDLGDKGVYVVLEERCELAGIPFVRPHDARRTFATDFIKQHGVAAAQKILGHKDVSTTTRYDMTGDDELAAMVSKIKR